MRSEQVVRRKKIGQFGPARRKPILSCTSSPSLHQRQHEASWTRREYSSLASLRLYFILSQGLPQAQRIWLACRSLGYGITERRTKKKVEKRGIEKPKKEKRCTSPSGNRTPVSRVTGGDTYHYTNEDCLYKPPTHTSTIHLLSFLSSFLPILPSFIMRFIHSLPCFQPLSI